MNSHSTQSESAAARLKRYRVLNSVGRRLFASFDTEEEAFGYIMDQPGPSCRFAFEDGLAPTFAPDVNESHVEPGPDAGFADTSSSRAAARAGRSSAPRAGSPLAGPDPAGDPTGRLRAV